MNYITDELGSAATSNSHGSFDISSAVGGALIFILITALWLLKLFYLNEFDDSNRSTIPVTHQLVEQPVQRVYNPFVVLLQETPTGTLSRKKYCKGADLKFSSHVHCRQAFYWAVNIDAFYAIIHLSWSDFVEKFSTSNSLFYDCSLQCEVVPEITSVCTDEIVTIPKCYLKSIGKPPRSVFPLVHVAYDADITCVTPANRVVILITVIHLRDEECAAKSHIIAQYVRIPNQSPFCLQTVYQPMNEITPTVNSSHSYLVNDTRNHLYTTSTVQRSETSEASDNVCVVCQDNDAVIVLLPCRHACLCDSCLAQMTACPVCRTNIDSYFKTTA